jgi:hypothetical protein
MRLYLIKIRGLLDATLSEGIINGIGYVLAENSSDAYSKMRNYIELKELARNKKDLALDKIELIAEESAECGVRLYL